MSTNPDTGTRSYGCSYGCGNPYDFVIVTVQDATATLMLCTPCFIRTAHDMVQGFVSAAAEVDAIVTEMGTPDQVPMNGPAVRRRGRNAPSGVEDPDELEEFEALDIDHDGDLEGS